jgi:hypothetical protein
MRGHVSMMTALMLAFAPVSANAALAEPPEAAQQQAPVEGPDPAPEVRTKARTLRRTGTGIMIGGGVIAATGLGLTITFTVLGDRAEELDEPVLADVQHNDDVARVGGILLASGLLTVAVGGIIFATSKKRPRATARVRVTPTLGGLVLQF